MTDPSASSPSRTASIVQWLRQANDHLSAWAAGLSWWRIILLFLLLLMAGQLVLEQLHLKHDVERVRVAGRKEPVVVTLGGKDGIRIEQGGDPKVVPPVPPVLAPPAQPDAAVKAPAGKPEAEPGGEPGAAAGKKPSRMIRIESDEDPEDRVVSRRVWTFRGLLGDLGATIMILLFAYLVAAKIIGRKVAQADAKVRTAEDAAGRAAMERQLVQAQLQVLQAQVEPHFLFNTLATVDYLIETDPARASQMQKKLITYLRASLPQMRQESSTLGRELRLIRSYLDLIKMRIEERLEVVVEVPDFLEPAEFPPMMLQSLVENAIKHGIEPKPEGGTVTVTARLQRGMLWVEVRDTGVGLVDTERLDAPTSGGGIGLANIRERLAMLYPGKGRLTLVSDDSKGTSVRIGVPYRDAEGEEPAAEPQGQAA